MVTGASKGIGFACAEAFARAGAGRDRVAQSRESRCCAGKARSCEGGVQSQPTCAIPTTAARAVDEAEAAVGPLDVLVNSAGAAKRYVPAELDAQAWRDAMDAKFFSYIFPTDIVVKRMAARGRGAIVNIIGMGGKVARGPHLAGGSANAALMLATAGLAAVYGPQGVRVNGINPGERSRGACRKGWTSSRA